ncbi:hypothetical protein [Paenibacillus polymyxa]|nr:hypothetical protein [Paenibacillus polymyxa]UZP77208.1 hypothetical protein MF627_06765 [Paenibacillus polymyxa]
MKRKYCGGKRIGNLLYVNVGGIWFEINYLIQAERECARYGAYTV